MYEYMHVLNFFSTLFVVLSISICESMKSKLKTKIISYSVEQQVLKLQNKLNLTHSHALCIHIYIPGCAEF